MKLFVNLFAVSGVWILPGTLRLKKHGLSAGLELPKWEYVHSVIFANEGKIHEQQVKDAVP
jgi:hypothetical protein